MYIVVDMDFICKLSVVCKSIIIYYDRVIIGTNLEIKDYNCIALY